MSEEGPPYASHDGAVEPPHAVAALGARLGRLRSWFGTDGPGGFLVSGGADAVRFIREQYAVAVAWLDEPTGRATAPLAPARNRHTFSLTQAGMAVGLLALASLAALYGSDRQFFVLAVFTACAFLVACATGLVYRPRVTVKASYPSRARVGETIRLDVEVAGPDRANRVPVSLSRVGVSCAAHGSPEPRVGVPGGAAGEVTRAHLPVVCPRRGVMQWTGFRAETSFPLGMLSTRQVIGQSHQVLVYPRFTPLDRLELQGSPQYQPGGLALVSDLGEGLEYIGNRPYRVGDSIRRVDWRATARIGEPVVREFREEYFLRVGVMLDAARPRPRTASDADDFEEAVSLCAAACEFLSRTDCVVDLYLGGREGRHVVSGRSLAQLDQVLEALAYVEQDGPHGYEEIEARLVIEGSHLTSLVCIFTDWTPERCRLVESLRERGMEVRVLVVRRADCSLAPDASGGSVTLLTSAHGVREL